MATPFASGYAPINLLNDAIQRQAAMGQAGYLDAQKINEAAISDSLNRAVQQRALQQQAAAQQQHYGLQQQQLANDLAYRNAAQGEAKRQFDLQYGLNKAITEAQLKNPFFGAGKDFATYGLQAGQDAAKYNQDALSGAAEANRQLDLLKSQHEAAKAKIKSEFHPFAQGDLLAAADAAYTTALIGIGKTVQHGDKIRFDPIKGKYEALHLDVPQFGPRTQPEQPTTPEPSPRVGEVVGPPNPFANFPASNGGATEIRPDVVPSVVGQNSLTLPGRGGFNPFSLFGRNQAAAPPVITPTLIAPGTTNRALRFDLNTGKFVPLQ